MHLHLGNSPISAFIGAMLHRKKVYRISILFTDSLICEAAIGTMYRKGAMAMVRILLSKKLGELRWTQADLVRATGIRKNTINDLYWEVADRVSMEHLDLICEALECELSEIVVRTPNDEIRTKTRAGGEKQKRSDA